MAGSCANGRPPSSCRSSHCDGRSRASGGRPDRPCTPWSICRAALSGPVQEDKAEAHAVLKRLVRVSHSTLESVDLKTIEGVCSREILVQTPCPRLEDLATAEVCRGVRIISYKDFVKALSLALPRFTNGDSIRLRQAAWHGERLFWAGERQACAFAAAIVYARRRELELKLPAHLERYELEPGALDELEQRYHMLRIPTQAWSEPTFMSLLLDTGLPYARLALFTRKPRSACCCPQRRTRRCPRRRSAGGWRGRRGEVSEATVGNRPGLASSRPDVHPPADPHRSDRMSLPRLSLCLALACGPALASQEPVYGERLEGFDYAYPVHYLDFTSQGQPLSMAYLDVAPKKPTAAPSCSCTARISAPGPGSAPSTCSPTPATG